MNSQENGSLIQFKPDLSWRAAWRLIKADLRRRLELEERPVKVLPALGLILKPGTFAVVAYRASTWLHVNGYSKLSRIVDLHYLFTGIEIQVGSRIGGGLVVRDQKGIGVHPLVTIGRNCTILGASSLTLGGIENIDPMRDRATIGDHCVIGTGTRTVGPIEIADGTQIKPNSVVVVSSLVPGSILSGVPARRRGTVPLESVRNWNPLKSRALGTALASPYGLSRE